MHTQLTLYYSAGANCCERVRWAIDFKRVPYVLFDVDAQLSAEGLAAINPLRRVPVMAVDGVLLTESMAMLEFLDELAPAPPLNYTAPFARAQVREMCEAVNASIHPVQNSSVIRHFRPDWSKEQMRPVRADWIAANLAKLESRLWRASGFAVGGQFTLADIFLAVIYRKGVALGVPEAAMPAWQAHWAFLMAHPAIRDSCPLPEARLQTSVAGM